MTGVSHESIDGWASQAELRDGANAIRDWSRHHANLFAGVWFDNEDASRHPVRSRLGVGVVSGVEQLTRKLSEMLAHPEALIVVGMKWTHSELDAHRTQVATDLLLSGPPSSAVTTDGSG
jgi:hypothetical protein